PPVLAAPIPGRPLVLYIAAQEHSIGTLLAQENDKGKGNALYYLSRMMTHHELNYSPIEKMCLALIFEIQKLRHYFQAHTVHLIS
ncbi:ribonuclease H family protein, partial [Enterococcus faecalis]|uniref:ribonuclease H family protein n=1 Tax=Enterococcus faecalis TaxID=1351 RepID=UPI003D6B90F2